MSKNPRRVILTVLLCLMGSVLAVLAIVWLRMDTTLELRLHDAVSGHWVFNSTIKVEDRVIRGFYQADSGDFTYRFTGLRPGAASVEISAPGYGMVVVPLRLHRGRNALPKPVILSGLEIPELKGFYIFEHFDGKDIVCELRPVGTNGKAILNHPCIDLWVGCTISVQLTKGLPSVQVTDTGSTRGKELFRGKASWSWDPAPETQFRYSIRIPSSKILEDPSPYRIIDYLVVVPRPAAIDKAELEALMQRVFAFGDRATIKAALDKEKDRVSWFEDNSINVPARPE